MQRRTNKYIKMLSRGACRPSSNGFQKNIMPADCLRRQKSLVVMGDVRWKLQIARLAKSQNVGQWRRSYLHQKCVSRWKCLSASYIPTGDYAVGSCKASFLQVVYFFIGACHQILLYANHILKELWKQCESKSFITAWLQKCLYLKLSSVWIIYSPIRVRKYFGRRVFPTTNNPKTPPCNFGFAFGTQKRGVKAKPHSSNFHNPLFVWAAAGRVFIESCGVEKQFDFQLTRRTKSSRCNNICISSPRMCSCLTTSFSIPPICHMLKKLSLYLASYSLKVSHLGSDEKRACEKMKQLQRQKVWKSNRSIVHWCYCQESLYF